MEHAGLIEQIERYRGYLPGPHLDLVCASMAAGNTAGDLWALPQGDRDQLPLLLLWDKGNNVFYLAGEARTPAALAYLAEVVDARLRPQALAEGTPHFKARALSPSLERALPDIFAPVALRTYPSLFYAYDAGAPPAEGAPPPLPDVTIVPLTRAALTRGSLVRSEEVRAEIRWMWPSEDRFFADGFGTLALVHGQIICWCTAEYVSPRRCGIGITTMPAYERHGVATATAARFVREAQRRGLTACWECGHDNHGSVRVAEKVGFRRVAAETYWIGSFAA